MNIAIAIFVLMCLILGGLGSLIFDTSLAVAVLPPAILMSVTVVRRLSMRSLLLLLFWILLVVDNPQERPAQNLWHSPFYGVGQLFYENLNKVVPVQALRFSGLDFLFFSLLGMLSLRRYFGGRRRDEQPTPSALYAGLMLSFVTLMWLEIFGLATGGDFKNSLWQIRQMFWMPLVTFIFAMILRGSADLKALAAIVLSSAVIKVMVGSYYYFFIARPMGNYKPHYCLTHSDTVLFVTALYVLVALYWEFRSRTTLLLNVVIQPIIWWGIQINNRRLAYASFLMGATFMFFIASAAVKKRITRVVFVVIPFLVPYIAVGWNSTSAVFTPVTAISSMFSKDDSSTLSRVVENDNLVRTLQHQPIIGSGFGHPYDEQIVGDSIADAFALYRYIGHNTILWLWSLAGVVGFTGVWLVYPIAVFLTVRSYRFARERRQRAAALVVLGVIVASMFQAWGDMGLVSWLTTLLVSMSIAMASKLAVETGAWPRQNAQLRKRLSLDALPTSAPGTELSVAGSSSMTGVRS